MPRYVSHRRYASVTALTPALVGFAFIVSAGGCLAPKRVEPLGEAVRTFNEAVRWQRFEMAAARVPPGQRDDFLDRRDQLTEDLRITHYEIIRVRYDKTRRRARVHIKYTWHLDSRGVVRTTHAVQNWHRPASNWLLLAEEHLRGESMPGLGTEPPADESGAPGPTDEPGVQGENADEATASGDANLREPLR